MIIVDHREHALIKYLGLYKETEIKNLTLGDIHILDADGRIVVVIERKTYKDLFASIRDTRWREQKIRLLESGNKILYVVETDDSGEISDEEMKICESAILNTMIRDNILVYKTISVEHTARLVNVLHEKACSGKFSKDYTNGSSVASIKKSKKTMENILAHQINAIPGVSMNIALKISEKFKTMKELVSEANDKGSSFLKDICLGKKMLGKKLSEKIYSCLIGDFVN